MDDIERKQIRFIDSRYNEKFRIPDGGTIRITFSNGEKTERTCRYIDDYHVKVGSNVFHICEFAERMEHNGNKVEPLEPVLSQKGKHRHKEKER